MIAEAMLNYKKMKLVGDIQQNAQTQANKTLEERLAAAGQNKSLANSGPANQTSQKTQTQINLDEMPAILL